MNIFSQKLLLFVLYIKWLKIMEPEAKRSKQIHSSIVVQADDSVTKRTLTY